MSASVELAELRPYYIAEIHFIISLPKPLFDFVNYKIYLVCLVKYIFYVSIKFLSSYHVIMHEIVPKNKLNFNVKQFF